MLHGDIKPNVVRFPGRRRKSPPDAVAAEPLEPRVTFAAAPDAPARSSSSSQVDAAYLRHVAAVAVAATASAFFGGVKHRPGSSRGLRGLGDDATPDVAKPEPVYVTTVTPELVQQITEFNYGRFLSNGVTVPVPNVGENLVGALFNIWFADHYYADELVRQFKIDPAKFKEAVDQLVYTTNHNPGGVAGLISQIGNYVSDHPAVWFLAPFAVAFAVGAFAAQGAAAAAAAGGSEALAPVAVTASYLPAVAGSTVPFVAGPEVAATIAAGALAPVAVIPALSTAATLAPVTVSAAQIVPTAAEAAAGATQFAPVGAAGSGAATLLQIPELANAAPGVVESVAKDVVNTVNSPATQKAIGAGEVPAPPSSLLTDQFKDWAVSTGVAEVEKKLGTLLTSQQQSDIEQQLAAEVTRLQQELASQGAPSASLPSAALAPSVQESMLAGLSSWAPAIVALVLIGVYAMSQRGSGGRRRRRGV